MRWVCATNMRNINEMESTEEPMPCPSCTTSFNSAFVRRSAAYDRARRAYLDAQTAARQYQAALQVAARDMGQGYQAILDLNAHHAVCPMGDDVYIQLGSGTVARE